MFLIKKIIYFIHYNIMYLLPTLYGQRLNDEIPLKYNFDYKKVHITFEIELKNFSKHLRILQTLKSSCYLVFTLF